MTRFEGFGPQVRVWFKSLEADNSREHFAATRDFFEESIREQMEALLTELSATFGGEVKMFRQNRDVRFSPDKSPYKTNTYGVLRGSDIAAQGLYASISAHGLVAGSGYHMMARDQLDRYREGVADQKHGPSWPGLWIEPKARAWSCGARASPPRRAGIRSTTSESSFCAAKVSRSGKVSSWAGESAARQGLSSSPRPGARLHPSPAGWTST